MQYSEPVEIQTRPQSRNEIYGHMEHLVQKHKRSYLVLNEEQRKQGNKKEKLTESLHLTEKLQEGWMTTWLSETSHKQNHCNAKWQAYQLSTMILHSQFNLAIQFQRQGEILLFTIKIFEMFELHASMPPMWSRAVIRWLLSGNPAKISHNYT